MKLSEITCRQNPCQERWISLFLTCINHHKILLQIYLQIRPHLFIVKGWTGEIDFTALNTFQYYQLVQVFSSTCMKLLSLVSLSVNVTVPLLLHLVLLAVYKLLEPGKVYESNFTFSYIVYTAWSLQKSRNICSWVINCAVIWESWQRCHFLWV